MSNCMAYVSSLILKLHFNFRGKLPEKFTENRYVVLKGHESLMQCISVGNEDFRLPLLKENDR